MIFNKISSFLFFTIFVFACSNNEEPFGIIEINGNYHTISTNGLFDIYIKQDTSSRVIIEYIPEKQDIMYKVDEDTLIINDRKLSSICYDKKAIIKIYCNSIGKIVTHGPSNVYSIDTLKLDIFCYFAIGEIGQADLKIVCNHFEMANSANTLGHFYFSGSANTIGFFNRYGCVIFANDLKTNFARVVNESVGDVYVNVRYQIDAYLRERGNIFYKGNPEIIISEDKKIGGKVISLN